MPARDDALDGVRGIAAATVFVYHLLVLAPAIADLGGPIEFQYYGRNLDVGVEIFFVLSGYLLSRPFFAAYLAGRHMPALRPYLIRRALRIYPAWWVFLTIAIVWGSQFWFLDGTDRHPDDLLRIIQWATLTHTWFFDPAHSSWTLSVEVAFYVFLPMFAWTLARFLRSRTLRAAIAMCGVVTIVGFLAEWFHIMSGDYSRFVPAALLSLGPGMALGAMKCGRGEEPWLSSRAATIMWVAAAGLFVAMSRFVSKSAYVVFGPFPPPREQVAQSVWQAVVATLVVAAVALGPHVSPVKSMARVRPLAAFGRVSYSFYLWHLIVLYQFDRVYLTGPGAAWWMGLRAFAITVVIAIVSYRLVERPCVALGNRLVNRAGRAGAVR